MYKILYFQRAVNGDYLNDRYVDRSFMEIG